MRQGIDPEAQILRDVAAFDDALQRLTETIRPDTAVRTRASVADRALALGADRDGWASESDPWG